MKKLVIFSWLLTAFVSCGSIDIHDCVWFINDTEHPIYYDYKLSSDTSIVFLLSYTEDIDVSLPLRLNGSYLPSGTYIPNMGTFIPHRLDHNVSVSGFWNEINTKNGLTIFMFDSLTAYRVPIEQVVKEYKVLARYYLSAEQIHIYKHSDHPLHFPPTPEMADIKMWPSYEELIQKYGSNEP